ncbi:hypothetical protein ACHAXR_009558 [Thalassiosira sp. AJA248-18]
MGDMLKASPTAKATHAGTLKSITSQNEDGIDRFAVSSMQGRRQTQEDAHAIETELRAYDATQNISHDILRGHAIFAVFDGHGTSFASNYAAKNFVSIFCKQKSFVDYSQKILDKAPQSNSARKKKGKSQKKTNYSIEDETSELTILLEDAIKATMFELDSNMLKEMTSQSCREKESASSYEHEEGLYDDFDSGTTAIVVILTPQYIVCANLGDSRAILQRGVGDLNMTAVTCLSTDHKPNNEMEEIRICNAGGVVLSGLIEGRLAVSRGFGDFAFKHAPSVICAADNPNENAQIVAYIKPEDQMVASIPEITILSREATQDKFLVIACDGIWDVVSNERCADIVSKIFDEGEQSLTLACEELLDQCYAKGSLDNMTAVLVKFGSQEIGYGGGVMKRRKQRSRKGR